MDLDLTGRRAIVTGGSRGIGLAVARALLTEGAHVVIAARDAASLEAAAQHLRQEVPGASVVSVPTDTSDDHAVRALTAATVERFGGVDILVNAAAQPAPMTPRTDLGDLDDDDLRREIETKVLGYLRTARAVAPHMRQQGWGRIINISGLAARQAASTFGSIRNVAVAAMTKNLADELGRDGINVTVVHPGMTVTERTPAMIATIASMRGISERDAATALTAGITIGRVVTAEEIGDVVAFLASPRSVAITGDAIPVAGGVIGPIHY